MKSLFISVVLLFFVRVGAEDAYLVDFKLNDIRLSVLEVTPREHNKFICKQLQLMKHTNNEKEIIWSIDVPDSRFSGTGYGAIRNISWFKENDSSYAYIAVVRNFLSPELILLEITGKENKILLNERKFSIEFLPSIDIKTIEILPSCDNHIVVFHVIGRTEEDIFFRINLSDNFSDIIPSADFIPYSSIPSELIWLCSETYSQERKKDFGKIYQEELESIAAFYKYRLPAPVLRFKVFFSKYLFYKFIADNVKSQSDIWTDLNAILGKQISMKEIIFEDSTQRNFFNKNNVFFMDSSHLMPYEVARKNIMRMLSSIQHFSCTELVDKPVRLTLIPSKKNIKRGFFDPFPPEELECRKREFLASQPLKELFSAAELEGFFSEPDYMKITDGYFSYCNGIVHPLGRWMTLTSDVTSVGTKVNGVDTIHMGSDNHTPYTNGTFIWNIPW